MGGEGFASRWAATFAQRIPDSVRLIAEPALLAVVTAALGLYGIGDKSFWVDEAYTYASVSDPWRTFLSLLISRDMETSAYFLLLKPWLVFGSSEASLRSLSVVFGVVAVLATWAIGRRYGVAFLGALLLAVSPFFVAYMQEARTYALFTAWSALSTLALLRMRERPSALRTLLYVALAATMVYVQPFGAFVICAHGAVLAYDARRGRVPWRRLLIYVPVVVAWMPLLLFALSHGSKIAYIDPTTVQGTVDALTALGGGALAAGGLLVLIVMGFRRDLLAAWLLAPIVGVLSVSLLVQPALLPRYLISVLPASALIGARNRVLPVTIVVVLSLVGTFNWYVNGQKDDWRSAAAWVSENVQLTDGIVFASDYGRLPFAYYARVADPIYPPYPWSQPYQTYGGEPNSLAGHPRIWLVRESEGIAPPALLDALSRYQVVETRSFGELEPKVSLLVAP